jgi:hypothetical protein
MSSVPARLHSILQYPHSFDSECWSRQQTNQSLFLFFFSLSFSFNHIFLPFDSDAGRLSRAINPRLCWLCSQSQLVRIQFYSTLTLFYSECWSRQQSNQSMPCWCVLTAHLHPASSLYDPRSPVHLHVSSTIHAHKRTNKSLWSRRGRRPLPSGRARLHARVLPPRLTN